jgi:hypothetical protein
MASIRVDVAGTEWRPGSPLYGAASVYEGRELVELKILSDRRAEGGGIAFLVKFTPPAGKLIKIVAVARSDEHVITLEGGRGTKTGQPLRVAADYVLNPQGQPHSAFIATETVSLVTYAGEPDEIRSIEVLAVGQRI